MTARTASSTRKDSKSKQRPVSAGARLFARGGIVYVPYRPYLHRLQGKFAAKNFPAHSNLLYPGLAHILCTDDSSVARLFVSILAVSKLGKNLAGLESLFLSCLHGLQFAGNRSLCLIGIGAWNRTRHVAERPLILVDRQRSELSWVPARHVGAIYRELTPLKLTQSTVGDILKSLEPAIESSPSSYLTKAEQVDAADCKDKWNVWTQMGAASASATAAAVSVGLAASKSDAPTIAAVAGAGALAAAGAAVMNTVGLYGCQNRDSKEDADAKQAQAAADQAVKDAQQQLQQQQQQQQQQIQQQIANLAQSLQSDLQEAALESAVRQTAGALSPPSDMGDYPGSVPSDPNGVVSGYFDSSDPAQEPPDTNDDKTVDGDQQPVDTGGPTAYATPNPDDAGESHAWPPGVHWPNPPADMPNPDDVGPGGPVSLPNGAIFLPSSVLTSIARAARIAVSVVTQSNLEKSAVATFQAVVTSSAAMGR